LRPDRKVLLAGMVAGVPGQAGWVWAVMHWAMGLRRLGHEVVVVEPVARITPELYGGFARLARTFGMSGRAALVTPEGEAAGLSYEQVAGFASGADLVLNLAGALRDPRLLEPVPVRVYLDVDPGFTQLWQEQCGIDMNLEPHTHFVTVGLNVGRPGSTVPDCGRKWIPILPPVDLDRWTPVPAPGGAAWTTVANWRGYGSIERDGVRHGQKAHSWRPLMDLPGLTGHPMSPALAIHLDESDDISALHKHGWHLLEPAAVAANPVQYRRFVRGSAGEIAVAKEGYVAARTGWFSDRSACYLAAGRPVVAQDTGWSAHVQAGEGLLAFETSQQAADAIRAVMDDYQTHSRAARRLASQVLDSQKIIGNLMEEIGL